MRYRLYQRRTKGKNWFVRFTCRGKQYRVSTKTDIRADAEVIAERIHDRAWNSIHSFHNLKLANIIELYLRYLRGRDAVMGTMETHAEFFHDQLGDRIAAEITTMAVHGALDMASDAKSWKPATYNRYLAFIKAVYNHAIHMDVLNANPAAKIKKKKEVPRDTFLKPAQVEFVLQQFNEARWINQTLQRQTIVAFLLAIHTGMRAGELLTMQWFDIDNVAATITLQAKNTKTLKKRTIPVSGYLLAELASIRPSGVIQTSRVFTMTYNNLRTAAGWITKWCGHDVKWHDLRHTFAVRARRSGMDMMTLMKVLGHADIASTQRYAEFGDDTEYTARFMPVFPIEGAK